MEDKAMQELTDVLGELDTLLKNNIVGGALADRGVNISLALVAVSGLRAYLAGNKVAAAEDFETVAEEIRTRKQSPILA
jgi:hypothetical protein